MTAALHLEFADEGALAAAISLSGCSDINLTDVSFANCPRDAAQIFNATGQVALTRVTLDGVGGSLVFTSDQELPILDLNSLTCTNTDQPIKISLHDGYRQRTHRYTCRRTRLLALHRQRHPSVWITSPPALTLWWSVSLIALGFHPSLLGLVGFANRIVRLGKLQEDDFVFDLR